MWVHPGLVAITGALILLISRDRVEKILFIVIPTTSILILVLTSAGYFGSVPFEDLSVKFLFFRVILARVDRLAMLFAYVFSIAALAMNIYALDSRKYEKVAAMIYFGSALGVVFAGDLFTFYVFWELMAIGSLFVIWSNETQKSLEAGFRYALWHLAGGAFLIAGIGLYIIKTGSLEFSLFQNDGVPYYLILLGVLINAAVPPLHAWLPDAYPEASVTGAVYLAAFTTKSAVYVLARGFAGEEILMYLGAFMAFYGMMYAIIESDIRRILAYSIVSQVGYMVAGIGIGTAIAINGAVSHAFTHILYKSLLFMATGAVIYTTGKSKLGELGGLYRYIPVTFYLYMIGALSISAVPLFSGFVSKTMTVYASHEHTLVWLLLEASSVGTFLYVGLKLPWNVWFARGPVIEACEPPKNMLAAMGFLAAVNVFVGAYPGYKLLYSLLPYSAEFHPYETGRVVSAIQMPLFAFLAFWIFRDKLRGDVKISLDTDWFLRIAGNYMLDGIQKFSDFSKRLDRNLLYAAEKLKTVGRFKIKEMSAGYGLIISIAIFALYLLLFLI